MLSIFLLAFLPQFVQANDPDTLAGMAGLSAVFKLLTFIVFVGYGLGAAALRRQVLTRPRVMTWMRRGFAGAFVAPGPGSHLPTADETSYRRCGPVVVKSATVGGPP